MGWAVSQNHVKPCKTTKHQTELSILNNKENGTNFFSTFFNDFFMIERNEEKERNDLKEQRLKRNKRRRTLFISMYYYE